MRKLLALGLLLIPFQPVIAAGMCWHAAAHAEDCGMPAQDMTPDSDQSQHNAPPDCTKLAICAPSAPVIPQAALQLVSPSLPSCAQYSTPALLLPGDPVAPPQPPPIA